MLAGRNDPYGVYETSSSGNLQINAINLSICIIIFGRTCLNNKHHEQGSRHFLDMSAPRTCALRNLHTYNQSSEDFKCTNLPTANGMYSVSVTHNFTKDLTIPSPLTVRLSRPGQHESIHDFIYPFGLSGNGGSAYATCCGTKQGPRGR